MKESPSCSRINKMDQQRVEEKNEKEEQSEESESVTDRSEEEMSDMMMHVAFEGGKESAKTYDPFLFPISISYSIFRNGDSQRDRNF